MEQKSLTIENIEQNAKMEVVKLKGYNELAKYSIFSINDVEKIAGNKKTAYSLIDRLMKKGLVKKIRNNIYSSVNPATGQIFATRYQVACAASPTAYISHHSAFEFYGLTNQVYYEVYVSSETKFRDFEFDNVSYKYISSRIIDGVGKAKNTQGVRITDLERTVLDSIKDYEKIGGLEELLNCLEGVHFLNEEKLKSYLEAYDTQALYQKTGYILSHYKDGMQLTEAFIKFCNSRIGKSTRYLLKEYDGSLNYDKLWRLVVPENLFEITEQGGDELV